MLSLRRPVETLDLQNVPRSPSLSVGQLLHDATKKKSLLLAFLNTEAGRRIESPECFEKRREVFIS